MLLRTFSGWVLNTSKNGDAATSPIPAPIFYHSHGEKTFPKIRLEFCFAVCVSCLLSNCCTSPRRVCLCLLCIIPLCSWGQQWDPPTFLFFRLNKSNSLSCSSYIHILLLDICFLSWLEQNLDSWIRCLNTNGMNLGQPRERKKSTVFDHNLRLVIKNCFRSPRVKERMTDPEGCCVSWWQQKRL